ncbi:protein of unknown function [Enterobacter cancerogenus]|nr:protein of unknown function [Enterobacter cancerogenus]
MTDGDLVRNLLQSFDIISIVFSPYDKVFPLNQGVDSLSWGSGEKENHNDHRKLHAGAFCSAVSRHSG